MSEPDNDEPDKLLISDEYKEIYEYAQCELSKLLKIKTANDLSLQCSNCINIAIRDRVGVDDDCDSIKRIMIVITAYHKVMHCNKLWGKVPLLPILTYENVYSSSQISDDFIHIQDHIDEDEKFGNEICTKFKAQFDCNDLYRCHGSDRWRHRLNHIDPKLINDEDNVFQQQCHKIYSYFTHCIEHDDIRNININHPQNENIPQAANDYVGKKEDDQWWDYKINEEDQEEMNDDDDDETDDFIYRQLVENMNIFRWQCPHGFSSKQHQSLMHLRAKYKNIKEEILQNPYYHLSTDNWNQTLRKSTVFLNSFARQRVKTLYDGLYDDKITQQRSKWKKGEVINMQEIVTLKLYTDFDKLQYELKKCFRFETISDVFTLKNFDPNNKNQNQYEYDRNAKELKYKLEERLQTFYWWRIRLLTVLNKFGQTLNNKMPLYHGVNAKMVINNAATQNLGFYGPLSTSSSYHVARTFATAKGMVLQVTTQYPRLGACRAFNASLISDYPEEKEWLIGFAYLRIKTVYTRPLNKKWRSFEKIDDAENDCKIPLSSKTRSMFFAIHLFRYQIFSMSVHLEYWLTGFLYLQCGFNEEGVIRETKFTQMLQKMIQNKFVGNNNEYDVKEQQKQHRILNILWCKFENFRKYPNNKQVVKIGEISDNLKPYFMDYDGEDIHKNTKYVISFTNIIKIFPNVREIHLMNTFVFDNIILNKFIKYLNETPDPKLKRIKFLYYDDAENGNTYFDLQYFDKRLLNILKQKKWEIKQKNICRTGYEIELLSSAETVFFTLC